MPPIGKDRATDRAIECAKRCFFVHFRAFLRLTKRTRKNAETFMESAFFVLFRQEKDGGQGWIRTSEDALFYK